MPNVSGPVGAACFARETTDTAVLSASLVGSPQSSTGRRRWRRSRVTDAWRDAEVPGEARLAAMLEDMPEEAGAAEVAVAVPDAASEARGDRVADDIAILVLRAL
jgi:hypothetical protein